ncbi:hypothetical protein BayCH28_20435 [Mycolicibacterium sp. CH28]|uniref:cellulose biosynthesis cyclic di-GMP-binding regulatory protein BcsB n=1 Tax=Mycolicibacterium sp. CH28 TaxID=2512237 RepID=UPI0010800AF5|nr:cellulose biosynthesis cyclic di-GMP-binding regulatory protein BcsB [Mycolicibacterium sp. CH28]TGD85406.1 hypothetical protein BayCH28_20435 [Mycolicibacterium sp. CH28]
MRWSAIRRLGAAAGVVATLLWTAPCAFAEPDRPPADIGGAVLTAPTLSFTDLGANSTVSFYGGTSSAEVSFPVPAGLTPTALNVTLDLPFNIRSGQVTASQGDVLVSKQGLPVVDLAPLVIPLSGVRVVGDVATVTLTLAARPDDGYCLDRLNPINLINGSVTFAGAEIPPTTVADFLPPLLRKLTIGVPASPSRAESDAAVQLAAALVKRYGSQLNDIAVVSLPDGATGIPLPGAPLERQVVIKEGPDEAVALSGTVGVPQLVISGPANKLTNETRLLTDGALNLAAAPRVVPDNLGSARLLRLPGDQTTVAQLGRTNLTSTAESPQVNIGLDQTRFGRPVQGIRVHLAGTYTPLPSTYGSQVTASVNGEVIDSWPTDAAGSIDRWVDVPDRLLARYTELQVAVNTTGDRGGCDDYRPMTLTIAGSSVVQSSPAVPPIPPGFGSLPQALMPTIQVGIGKDAFTDTVRASQIVVGLQRLSALPLRTAVTSLDQALASQDPAVLISADGWTDSSITLPVSANAGRITLAGQGPDDETSLTLDPGVRFGSLQTVFDGHRSLLIATSNGAPGELDGLLRWLNADRSRWSQLRGSAIVAIAGRTPAMVAGRTPVSVYGPDAPAPQASATASGRYRYDSAWWVAAAVVGVAAAGVGAIVISARRSPDASSNHRRGS